MRRLSSRGDLAVPKPEHHRASDHQLVLTLGLTPAPGAPLNGTQHLLTILGTRARLASLLSGRDLAETQAGGKSSTSGSHHRLLSTPSLLIATGNLSPQPLRSSLRERLKLRHKHWIALPLFRHTSHPPPFFRVIRNGQTPTTTNNTTTQPLTDRPEPPP